MTGKLLVLAELFGRLSVLAFGGINSTVPEIAHQVVDVHHWSTATQFSQLYALANSAPGPNMLIVTLIGAREAGVAGGIVASLAMILPSGILVMMVSGVWERFRAQSWRRVVQTALLPITAGLILSAGVVLVHGADRSWLFAAITLVSTVLIFGTRLHPVWVLAGGAVLGLIFA